MLDVSDDWGWSHIQHDRALTELIHRTREEINPIRRLSFPEFYNRVEALRRQAEEEERVYQVQAEQIRKRAADFEPPQAPEIIRKEGRNTGNHLRQSEDSFDRAIDNGGMRMVDSLSDDETHIHSFDVSME